MKLIFSQSCDTNHRKKAIEIGGLPKVTGKERTIEIVYKVDIASVLRYKLQK